MCGIYGLLGFPETQAKRMLDVMGAQMLSRGPDDAGEYREPGVALGMRRLAIIDPKHGAQPQISAAGNLVCFQNGEIYNHRSLRHELQQQGVRFRTDNDTEVLAQGFAHWGLDQLLSRIDGMYAIAFLDRENQELILARDRFGEKPLFFTFAAGRFAYSSDLLTLAALPGQNTTPDPLALERYLALHYCPGRQTIFSGIQRVLPGELIRISLENRECIERRQYFVQSLESSRSLKPADLASLLEDAVRSRLVADVPVGIFLSGGLDSSLVAAIAARSQPGISTFSMGFADSDRDESPFARSVAAAIGADHHHFEFDADHFQDLLPRVAAALDEPVGDQALLPLYWLCREASQHVRVVLAGEGADEVFAGYEYYRPYTSNPGVLARLRQWSRGVAEPARQAHLIDHPVPISPSGFPLLTDQAGRRALLSSDINTGCADPWETDLMAWLETASSPLQRATAADLSTWLADDLLVKFDRMAMAHSLEGRAPFLAPPVVDAGLHLPGRLRYSEGVSKIALRKVAQDWLPAEILQRRKQGFVLPMRQWLENWFRKHGGVVAYLSQHDFPGIDPEALTRRLEQEAQSSYQNERFVFALILLLEWYRNATDVVMRLRAAYTVH